MLSKTLSMIFLSILFALTAPAVNAADRTEPQANTAGGTELKARTSTTKFLKPLALKFILSPDDPLRPQFCARLRDGTRCPPIISAEGGIPNIDPAFQADLPNVRVTFFMQEIENEVIADEGVDTDLGPYVHWITTGTEADVENGFGYISPLPGPGGMENFGGDSLMIYDALVFNACGSFSSFPVTHQSELFEDGDITLGLFIAFNDSTIDSTGFYNLKYTVRANNPNGVSDFHFSGKASVTCSALNALP